MPPLRNHILAITPPADPHPELWTEWQCLRDLHDGPDVVTGSPEGDVVYHEMERVGHLIRTTVATTAAGLIAQFEYLTSDVLDDGHGCDTVVEVMVPALDAFRAGLEAVTGASGTGCQKAPRMRRGPHPLS